MSYLAGGMQIFITTWRAIWQYVVNLIKKSILVTQEWLGCTLKEGSANIFYKGIDNKCVKIYGLRDKIKDNMQVLI